MFDANNPNYAAIMSLDALQEPVKNWPTKEAILNLVSYVYSMPIVDIKGPRKDHQIIAARFCYYWICRNHTPESLVSVGRFINKSDHVCVMNGCKKVKRFWPAYREPIGQIEKLLRARGFYVKENGLVA
jgi:chromosomal replication initiation ATPase DnaA